MEKGNFREDLYYRLSVFPIEISPLRDRPEDIAPLIEEFMRRLHNDRAVSLQIDRAAMELLDSYAWPGNVRELANLIERLVVIRPNGIVTARDLPWPLVEHDDGGPDIVSNSLMVQNGVGAKLPEEGFDLKEYLAGIERDMIARALEESNGVVQHAAEILGVGRTTLVEKIRRYQIK